MKSHEELAVIDVSPKKVQCFYRSSYPKICYEIEHKKPKTLGENFMLGVKNTDSKYLVRIDGDDSWDCTYDGKYALEMLDHHNEYKAVYPFYRLFKITPPKPRPDKSLGTIEGCQTVNIINSPQGAGIVYDREAFMSVGGYDKTLQYQADLDFYIRFRSQYLMGIYPSIYWWRLGDNQSITHKDKLLAQRKKILHKYDLEEYNIPHFGAYAYV